MNRNKNVSWSELMTSKKTDSKSYKTSNSYYVGDFISHTTFGEGYIQGSFGNKVEVLFEDEVRTLTHMVMF
ncbi:MAG: hypothetical protein KC478_05725 [Bacteriovoracaceae bacterium]|nr:hypothetical protein [Bacteriovoracaceae bacterium]